MYIVAMRYYSYKGRHTHSRPFLYDTHTLILRRNSKRTIRDKTLFDLIIFFFLKISYVILKHACFAYEKDPVFF